MNKKQEHKGTGDNIGGNKFQQNNYINHNDLSTIIKSKISNLNNKQNFNLKDNKILTALKQVILELIEVEQNKSHQIVPIYKVQHKFKDLFDESTFEMLIKQLIEEKSIEIEDSQNCYIKKQTNFKINI